MKEGVIKFNGYCVESMNYSKNNDYKDMDEFIDLSPQFLFKITINNKIPEKYNLIIGARIGYSGENSPFKSEVVLRGFFEIRDSEYRKETLQKIYIINSSAILFPYLRSTITDITSKSNHAPIILPTFNFHTVVDDLSMDDLIIDSSEYREYERI